MKWTSGDRGNIEDARGSSGGMGIRAGGLGIGGLLLVLVLSWATGIDFLSLLGGGGAGAPPSADVQPGGPPPATSPAEESAVDMVDAVMDDAQQTWQQVLGNRYRPTTAVLFRDAIQSGLRLRPVRDRAVLLPGRPQGLSRSRVLQRAAEPLRRARRFRAGVCHRPRARPSRPVADGYRCAGAPRPVGAPRPAERAVGGARAAGRLLRRRLGPPRREGSAAAG